MSGSGDQTERLAFDEPVQVADEGGVTRPIWTQRHVDLARMVYHRGGEAVEAARLTGRQIFKVRIGQCAAARRIDQTWRMRDLRRGMPDGAPGDTLPGTRYAIREVDTITDRQWIYLVVESGVQP